MVSKLVLPFTEWGSVQRWKVALRGVGKGSWVQPFSRKLLQFMEWLHFLKWLSFLFLSHIAPTPLKQRSRIESSHCSSWLLLNCCSLQYWFPGGIPITSPCSVEELNGVKEKKYSAYSLFTKVTGRSRATIAKLVPSRWFRLQIPLLSSQRRWAGWVWWEQHSQTSAQCSEGCSIESPPFSLATVPFSGVWQA